MSTICIKLSCIETSEIVGNDVYASSFLTIFRFVEWSVAERKTEKSRRRFGLHFFWNDSVFARGTQFNSLSVGERIQPSRQP